MSPGLPGVFIPQVNVFSFYKSESDYRIIGIIRFNHFPVSKGTGLLIVQDSHWSKQFSASCLLALWSSRYSKQQIMGQRVSRWKADTPRCRIFLLYFKEFSDSCGDLLQKKSFWILSQRFEGLRILYKNCYDYSFSCRIDRFKDMQVTSLCARSRQPESRLI